MSRRRGAVAVSVALFCGALALRPQLVGVGPLLPRIQADLGVSHAIAGLLGTIPVLCMGLFAPPSRGLSRRYGSRIAVCAALACVAVFGVARALAPGAAAVIALTVPVGVGMGVGGALLPVAVKERFPHRPAFATGIYATGISSGAAASAALAVPLAGLDSWRTSLLAFSLFTALLVPVWLLLTRGGRRAEPASEHKLRLPLSSRLIWRLVAVFGLMSVTYYGLNAWLPDSYVERGWSESSAGTLLAVINVASLPPTLFVPWLADRRGSRRLYLLSAGGVLVAAMLGLVLAPAGGWVWSALVGAAFGVLFPLVMTLPLDLAERPAEVGAIAAAMLGGGYAISGTAPFALGALRDGTGSFTSSLWVLVATASLLVVLCAPLSTRRLAGRPAARAPSR